MVKVSYDQYVVKPHHSSERGSKSEVKVMLSSHERDRLYRRMDELEQRQDALHAIAIVGTFAILAIGTGVAVYQNRVAIQSGATWVWESVPTLEQMKTSVFNAWNCFSSFFASGTNYNYNYAYTP